MTLTDLIEEYRKKLEINPHDTACLLFALQIPSICSRIEFPKTAENTGTLYRECGIPKDKNMYIEWLSKHRQDFLDIYCQSVFFGDFCENLYKLRCQMTHEGVIMTNESKFYFIKGDIGTCVGDIIFLPIKRLCEDMFNIADAIMNRLRVNIEVTPISNVELPTETYNEIYNDATETYKSFWKNYSFDDNLLICIYDIITFYEPDMKNKIDDFFKNNPNDIFKIWDFGYKWGHYITDIEKRFIHEVYDESKSSICRNLKRPTNVFCLNKQEYERMLQIDSELKDYEKQHPIDVMKYIDKMDTASEDIE